MALCANHPYAYQEAGPPESVIFGKSETMAAVRRNLLKVADTNIPVLIEGESGTGKEVICHYLHRHSVWQCGPIMKVSCPAIPGTTLESELFGQQHGTFAAAFSTGTGDIEMASRGTLFLDEISELNVSVQSKFLQALQDGQLQTIGSTLGKKADIRVICTTNRQLQQEVKGARFRQDLYYRISGLVLRLPPLRERLEDLNQLSEYFVALYNERYQCSAAPLSQSTLLRMTTHSWTGNIRELENLVKRYVVEGNEEAILRELAHREGVPVCADAHPTPALSLGQLTRDATRAMESRIILSTLRANQWNRKRTAHALKISYRSLLYKLHKSGIQSRHGADSADVQGKTLENLS